MAPRLARAPIRFAPPSGRERAHDDPRVLPLSSGLRLDPRLRLPQVATGSTFLAAPSTVVSEASHHPARRQPERPDAQI